LASRCSFSFVSLPFPPPPITHTHCTKVCPSSCFILLLLSSCKASLLSHTFTPFRPSYLLSLFILLLLSSCKASLFSHTFTPFLPSYLLSLFLTSITHTYCTEVCPSSHKTHHFSHSIQCFSCLYFGRHTRRSSLHTRHAHLFSQSTSSSTHVYFCLIQFHPSPQEPHYYPSDSPRPSPPPPLHSKPITYCSFPFSPSDSVSESESEPLEVSTSVPPEASTPPSPANCAATRAA